jgi:hypothetical protein
LEVQRVGLLLLSCDVKLVVLQNLGASGLNLGNLIHRLRRDHLSGSPLEIYIYYTHARICRDGLRAELGLCCLCLALTLIFLLALVNDVLGHSLSNVLGQRAVLGEAGFGHGDQTGRRINLVALAQDFLLLRLAVLVELRLLDVPHELLDGLALDFAEGMLAEHEEFVWLLVLKQMLLVESL